MTPRSAHPLRAGSTDESRRFDGVIAFGGEDWWYHNRGHYDMRMMMQFARRVPVLYVNSIGMRMPSPGEGRMFLHRIRRKVRSVLRGCRDVGDGMHVYSPMVLPGPTGLALTRGMMIRSLRRRARRLGMRRPLIWINCPTGAEFVDALDPAAVVYQRTDRYESFDGVDPRRIRDFDTWLKARADMTLFCSSWLHEQEQVGCRAAHLVDHGVDAVRFAASADDTGGTPADLACLPGPRVGFVGGIDDHTFDPELFCTVAQAMPDVQFVLVGACSLPDSWCPLPNVAQLGQRPLAEVPAYAAGCDVLIMPWRQSPWIRACNPIKLKEYLATGRPVVSTDFPELSNYRGLVDVAHTPECFVRALRRALEEPADSPRRADRRARVTGHTWADQAQQVVDHLADLGIELDNAADESGTSLVNAPHRPKNLTTAPAYGTASPAPLSRRQVEVKPILPIALPAAHIILSGGLRPSPLAVATEHSVLDLYLNEEQTVLDAWVSRLGELSPPDAPDVPIRVVHDSMVPAPWPGSPDHGQNRARHMVSIEHEPRAFRGPAGLLRDLCRGYDDDRLIFVSEAARYVHLPLHAFVLSHYEHRADVTGAVNPDGSPAGLYLIRCGALGLVPDIGYTDLKEQWLNLAITEGLDVRVFTLGGHGALPLRTRLQFLRCGRLIGGFAPTTGSTVVIRDPDEPPFRVICPGAIVKPDSRIIDSIIMPGAIVEPGATVIRTLVCPNTRVQAMADIADAVVSAGAVLSDQEAYCVA